MDRQLRIIAAAMIVESKLSKASKQQLLNFIKEEATDSQVKALLMDGKIVKLDEQAGEIVNDRFKNHPINETIIQEGGWKTLAGVFLLGPAGWALYRAIRAMVDKKSRQCGIIAIGRERDVCLWKLRAEENQKLAQLINSNLKNCKSSKNPEKCMNKGKELVRKYNEKAKKYMDRINTYKAKSPSKGGKAEAGLLKAQQKSDRII